MLPLDWIHIADLVAIVGAAIAINKWIFARPARESNLQDQINDLEEKQKEFESDLEKIRENVHRNKNLAQTIYGELGTSIHELDKRVSVLEERLKSRRQ